MTQCVKRSWEVDCKNYVRIIGLSIRSGEQCVMKHVSCIACVDVSACRLGNARAYTCAAVQRIADSPAQTAPEQSRSSSLCTLQTRDMFNLQKANVPRLIVCRAMCHNIPTINFTFYSQLNIFPFKVTLVFCLIF